MPSKQSYIITFQPLPDRPGKTLPPAEIRVRQLLKMALRGFNLRAVDVRETPAPQVSPEPRDQ